MNVMAIHLDKLKQNAIYYAVILVLVMFTDTLWIRNVSFNRFYLIILIGIIVLFSLLMGLFYCNRSDFFTLCVTILPIILAMVVNMDFDTLIFFKIAVIIICWSIIVKYDMNKMLNCYIDFMIFISVFSLICMLFRQNIIALDFLPTINSGTYGTKALFFTNVKIGSGNVYFLRNQGPFWEPGVYQAYLNMAIMFLLFGKTERKHKKLGVLILCITVASTLSTTGYLVLGVLLLIKVFTSDASSFGSKLGLFFLLCIVVVVAFNNETVRYLLFDKMRASSSNSISSATRLYSVTQNLSGIASNPIFGLAPDKYLLLFSESTSVFGDVSLGVNTTTSLSVWALYGIVYFIIFNVGLIFFVKSFNNKSITNICLLVAIFIIYNTENVNYSLFFNFISIWGCCQRKRWLT